MSGEPEGPGMFRDRYGFFFWLAWILWFAGSFVLSALGWTFLMKKLLGAITGAELTLAWVVCVFGGWFILVIPFMRKKERIWKRLNTDQEKAVDAWLLGMGIFIGSLAAAALGWSWVFRAHLHEASGFYGAWAKAVFGTWFAVMIPFLVLMYLKADAIFKTASARQTYQPNYRTAHVEAARRLLPEHFSCYLLTQKPVLSGGYLVNLRLKDGREVPHVFVLRGKEIAGIYDRPTFDFEMAEIESVVLIPTDAFPDFKEAKWLRLDVDPNLL